MSLIESALEKLRRGGEGNADSAPVMRSASSAVAPKAPVVALAPVSDEPARRITIDSESLRRAGYLPEEGLERRFADHYRQVKRPLIEKALNGGPEMRILLVTSALPGDGKTFTSINLALSMARERDVSVLLVDADGPKAQVSEVLNLKGERGLLDALGDESLDIESLVVRTDIRGLEVLPAGRFIENATELLASARMSQLASRLAARNSRRLIVFDSAPLLVSSEARALTRIPGQIVLVVRAGATPQQAVVDAVAHLERQRLQGLVVNQARFSPGDGYYGYPSYGEANDKKSGAD